MKPKEPTAKCNNPSLANELNRTRVIIRAQLEIQELIKRLRKIEKDLEQNLKNRNFSVSVETVSNLTPASNL